MYVHVLVRLSAYFTSETTRWIYFKFGIERQHYKLTDEINIDA